jgi:hypothetical protein
MTWMKDRVHAPVGLPRPAAATPDDPVLNRVVEEGLPTHKRSNGQGRSHLFQVVGKAEEKTSITTDKVRLPPLSAER